MAMGNPIPVRLFPEDAAILADLEKQTGLKQPEIMRRAARYFFQVAQRDGIENLIRDTAQPISQLAPRLVDEPGKYSPKTSRRALEQKAAQLRDIAAVSLSVFEISAGQPLSPADSPVDKIKVPQKFDLPGAFVLRVNGDSMDAAELPARLGAGPIRPGDHVIMQWAEHREPRHRDIVAVQIHGNGSTLKELRQHANAPAWLEPRSHNKAHRPITLENADGETLAKIQAVMIGKV